jgi:hypothetical protein
MYPKKEMSDLDHFVLCKDTGECCFGGNPKPTDMILIEMNRGVLVDHRTGLVAVAGVFHTHSDAGVDGLNPVYKLDCSHFDVARTSYK